jgi:acyl dehydratase
MAAFAISVQEASGIKGKVLGTTGWRKVTQDEVNDFARATGDHQWIHIDPERAARESPFKKTIAHGYLSLSLVPVLLGELLDVQGAKMGINYGANKIRFPAPVPVGSNVRLAAEIADVEAVDGGVQLTVKATVEIEGGKKPALAAELLYRYYV